jgi:CubicO group peptidase (beta-lactamase class C family)
MRRLRISVLAIAMILLLEAGAPAQQSALKKGEFSALETELARVVQTEHLPSLSIAILRDGKMVYANAFGYADVEKQTLATTHTLYRLASISKLLTAVAALQLAAANQLDLDKSAQQYCPVFDRHPEVTARELLSHRSGVDHYESDTAATTVHFANLSEAVKSFANDPLLFEAGKRFQYGSYGFTVLGCEIEGASQDRYEDYVIKHVLTPAKMGQTVVDDSQVSSDAKAAFYSPNNKELLRTAPLDTSDRLPGGGWLSTPTDMVQFARAVMSHELLNGKWTSRMWTETTKPGEPMHYGLGWMLGLVGTHTIVGHAGGQAGTSTSLVLVPDAHLAVAVFSNRDGADMTRLSQKVAAELLGVDTSSSSGTR